MFTPFRYQLPAYSPLHARQLAGGACAVLRDDGSVARVHRTLLGTYAAAGAITVDSGTTALRLALDRRSRDGLVALPAYGCFDLATAAIGAGAKVRLYDIDPVSLGPDMDQLATLLRDGVNTVVVTHLYGVPVDMMAVQDLARSTGALVIEDAAQGAGGSIAGKPLGAFGDLSVLSFGRGKGITGIRGGALLSRADEPPLAPIALQASRGLGELLRGIAQYTLGRPSVYGVPLLVPGLRLGETVFHEPWAPRAMSRAAAAMAAYSLQSVEKSSSGRRSVAQRLLTALAPTTHLGTRIAREAREGFLRLPILAPSNAMRELLVTRGARHGIARGYPITLRALPELQAHLVGDALPISGAQELSARLVTLPTHEFVTDDDVAMLVRCVEAFT